jgi:hypothetical protein
MNAQTIIAEAGIDMSRSHQFALNLLSSPPRSWHSFAQSCGDRAGDRESRPQN